MLARDHLAELYRELRDVDTLSVYIDGDAHDPADRRVWTLELEHRLGAERSRLESRSPEDLERFDAARSLVMGRLADHPAFLPGRGWVAFATPSEVRYSEPLPVPMPHLVRWERGIRVAPYVRALKQERAVTVVLADRRRARIFTYRNGELDEREDLIREPIEADVAELNMSKRASTHSGVRGQTSTDAARAAVEAHWSRLRSELVRVIRELTGSDGFVVIGGTPEVVAALGQQVSDLGGRVLPRPSMHFEMSDAEVKEAVEEAASELSRRWEGDLLDEVVDRARSGGKGCLGAEATEKALRERRVDTLLITRRFRERDLDHADHCVGAAFEQSAAVEELSGAAADLLDAEGEGIAARLRYTVSG